MTVQISAIGADSPLSFPDDVVKSSRLLKAEAAANEYAPHATDLVLPPQDRIVATVTYSPLPAAPSVAPAVPEYAPHATDLVLPASERRRPIPWGTIGIVAGVVGVVGIVGYMMFKPTRGFSKPAMAGLHGRRRRRHRR